MHVIYFVLSSKQVVEIYLVLFYFFQFSNHESFVVVKTIRMLKTSTVPLADTESKWQMEASKALKYDRSGKPTTKDNEKKKPIIKRTIQIPKDEKPKTSKF